MHYYPIGVLTVSWVFYLWESYLDMRQYKVYKNTKQVPEVLADKIDNKTFEKSRAYCLDKARFSFITSIFGQLQSTCIIVFFLTAYFWNISGDIMTNVFGLSRSQTIEWEIFQSLIFTFLTSLCSMLIGLPLSIYETFVIEQKHGFNKQTARFYAWDKTKMFLVSFIITAPVMSAMIYIVQKGGPYFFLYLWLFCFMVIIVLMLFHGEIMALFDKFTPLPEGELRTGIENLATSLKFPLSNIFVVEGSKRSSHSNAYQSGLFNKKRIVIYDTLIEGYQKDDQKDETKESPIKPEDSPSEKKQGEESEKKSKGCNNEEILAVLCHELGHWQYSHLFKNLIFAETNYFFMFMIFSKFYRDPVFYSAFGFNNEMPTMIGLALFMSILTPYSQLISFISTSMSRRFEYQADNFAMKLGHSEKLKSALVKLNLDNLNFPVHDELYSKFNHSHPTLIQRLKALDKAD